MSDEEDHVESVAEDEPAEEEPEAVAEPEPEPVVEPKAPSPKPSESSNAGGDKEQYKATAPTQAVKDPYYSSGRQSKLPKQKLMAAEGIVRNQSGSNKYATQAGQTGFGVPRDVVDHTVCNNLKPLEEKMLGLTKTVLPLQTGTNKYASQKGTSGFGAVRDVLSKPKGTGGTTAVPEEKARITEGIIPLQSGTNKLASQQGMTGMGAFRLVFTKLQPNQDKKSEGFINLQMGTNRLANQAGMTGFGMPRLNLTNTVDAARGEIPNNESILPKQTVGSHKGANQMGMTGFGMPRKNTYNGMIPDEKGAAIIPYQMGINWADSQAGMTGFGTGRTNLTTVIDETHDELPEELARDPNVPRWSMGSYGMANQSGMRGMGMPRDVKGTMVRRLW